MIMSANDSWYWVGSGWVQIFPTCSGLGRVSQLMVGLDRVTQNGPMDNSVAIYRTPREAK